MQEARGPAGCCRACCAAGQRRVDHGAGRGRVTQRRATTATGAASTGVAGSRGARASQAAEEHGRRRRGTRAVSCDTGRVPARPHDTLPCGGGGRESRDLTDEVQGDLTGRGPAAASRARSKASWRVGRRRRLACWRCEEWRCQHATDVGRRRRLAPTQASRRHGSDAGAGESPRAG